jgi:isopropylmalate/homocitrate/citramalate synthase
MNCLSRELVPNHRIVRRYVLTSPASTSTASQGPSLYEAFDPASVGATRRIVLGKHSGRSSIKHKLRELGLSASPALVDRMRDEVGRIGEEKKGNLTDSEFLSIYQRLSGLDEKEMARDSKRMIAVDIGIMSER